MVSRIPRFPSVFFIAALAWADLTGPFVAPLEHPAIEYSARASTDPIAALKGKTVTAGRINAAKALE